MASEYKGYTITHHKDGTYSLFGKELEFALANGDTEMGVERDKTLEGLHSKIDAFVSECEAKDKKYNDTLADLTKQINEMQDHVELGIKSVKEKTLEALQNAVRCGELLTR